VVTVVLWISGIIILLFNGHSRIVLWISGIIICIVVMITVVLWISGIIICIVAMVVVVLWISGIIICIVAMVIVVLWISSITICIVAMVRSPQSYRSLNITDMNASSWPLGQRQCVCRVTANHLHGGMAVNFCDWMSSIKSTVYRMKNSKPRADHWGTS